MEESTLYLKNVMKTIKKRKRTIGKIFFGCIMLTLLLSLMSAPVYEAEAVLRIKQPKGLPNSLLGDFPVWSGNKQQMSTYVEILRSRTVIQEVIDKTQADREVKNTYEAMLGNIMAQPVKDTEILKIKARAYTPEEAQLIANTATAAFVARMTALLKDEQAVVRDFIGARLRESQQDLEQAEKELEQYKRTAKIVDPQSLLQNKIQSEAELAAAFTQKPAIAGIMAGGKQELDNLPAKEQGLVKLMRDVSVAQEIYIMLAKRHEEARISEAMQPTEIQVIDVANLPEKPVSPRTALNVLIAAQLGIFAGLLWAFFREYMDKSIRTPEDVRKYLDLPLLGSIPGSKKDAALSKDPGLWARMKQLMYKKKSIPGSM